MPNVHLMNELPFHKQNFALAEKTSDDTEKKLSNDQCTYKSRVEESRVEKNCHGQCRKRTCVYKVTCWTFWRYTFSTCQDVDFIYYGNKLLSPKVAG